MSRTLPTHGSMWTGWDLNLRLIPSNIRLSSRSSVSRECSTNWATRPKLYCQATRVGFSRITLCFHFPLYYRHPNNTNGEGANIFQMEPRYSVFSPPYKIMMQVLSPWVCAYRAIWTSSRSHVAEPYTTNTYTNWRRVIAPIRMPSIKPASDQFRYPLQGCLLMSW